MLSECASARWVLSGCVSAVVVAEWVLGGCWVGVDGC